jgi:hypothetical protein
VVLTRTLLDFAFLWLASAPIIAPGLVELVPLLLLLTVTSTLALASLPTASVLTRRPVSLRVQWLRSIGVPATGLSGLGSLHRSPDTASTLS